MTMIKVSKLSKQYGTKQAVNQISFSLSEGRCVALLGPNGAGKTTTLNMLSGLLQPSSGHIQFQGIGEAVDLRAHIGYLPQYASFYPWMTGREFLTYTGRLANMSKQDAQEKGDTLLELVGLEDAKKRKIGGYSGGMKQRLGLAQALIHQPRLLILDEPVSALDPIGRREVLELLKKLKQQMTILFSTHVLPDAEEICDDIMIIRQGEIVISGSLADIRAEHQLPELTLEFTGLTEDTERSVISLLGEVDSIQRRGQALQITFKHREQLEQLRQPLLSHLAERNAPLRRFEIGQSTLEDLFMKAVQQ